MEVWGQGLELQLCFAVFGLSGLEFRDGFRFQGLGFTVEGSGLGFRDKCRRFSAVLMVGLANLSAPIPNPHGKKSVDTLKSRGAWEGEFTWGGMQQHKPSQTACGLEMSCVSTGNF